MTITSILPPELVRHHVETYMRPEWMKFCSRQHYRYFLDSDPVADLMIQWIHYRKREESTKKKLAQINLEILAFDQIKPCFHHFRDVDRHFIRRHELEGEKEDQNRRLNLFQRKATFLYSKLKKHKNPSFPSLDSF